MQQLLWLLSFSIFLTSWRCCWFRGLRCNDDFIAMMTRQMTPLVHLHWQAIDDPQIGGFAVHNIQKCTGSTTSTSTRALEHKQPYIEVLKSITSALHCKLQCLGKPHFQCQPFHLDISWTAIRPPPAFKQALWGTFFGPYFTILLKWLKWF